jgi:hypothetical protein
VKVPRPPVWAVHEIAVSQLLEGIMPRYDPLGDRSHDGWHCIDNLKRIIDEIESGKEDRKKMPI